MKDERELRQIVRERIEDIDDRLNETLKGVCMVHFQEELTDEELNIARDEFFRG